MTIIFQFQRSVGNIVDFSCSQRRHSECVIRIFVGKVELLINIGAITMLRNAEHLMPTFAKDLGVVFDGHSGIWLGLAVRVTGVDMVGLIHDLTHVRWLLLLFLGGWFCNAVRTMLADRTDLIAEEVRLLAF